MKRVLSFLALFLLPLSLMAMTPISDEVMSQVTAQAGVSIDVDVTMEVTFGNLGWGDLDTGGGWVGLDSFKMSTLHIWPRTDYTMEYDGTENGTMVGMYGDGGWNDLKMMTIDIVTSTDAGLVAEAFGTSNPGHVTYVQIGIPTLTITMDAMVGNVVLGPSTGATTNIGGVVNGNLIAGTSVYTPDFDQVMGKFYVGGLNMATGGGNLNIYAHGRATTLSPSSGTLYGSGVTLWMENLTVSYLLINEAAWGDFDGASIVGYSNNEAAGLKHPGWVGLANIAIKNLVINGKVMIDVASFHDAATGRIGSGDTTSTMVWANLIDAYDDIYTATNSAGQNGHTFVQIAFVDGFNVSVGLLAATAVLNEDASGTQTEGTMGSLTRPSTTNQTLGSLYIGGMGVTFRNNQLTGTPSCVRIFAH